MTSSNCPAPPLLPEIETALKNYPKEDVVDGNGATAHVAYACSDAAFIYPITPSSTMAETYEMWSAQKRRNVFGQVCMVKQLQSEAGAAGSVHGSLSAGAITTTFTASQGLLLMIPPMYKIAGELIPCVFHVSARSLAGQALCIFGDHSDVMACRQCGWAMLSSASVQEAQDLAVISHMATLRSRVPFIHFFDGFRTSHEIQKINMLSYAEIRELMDWNDIQAFRDRALNPTHPYTKGTAQGPEVFFQNVELSNSFYEKVPGIVEHCMEIFKQKTGRSFKLFDYFGSEEATDVLVIMGAGGPVCQEVIEYLQENGDDKVGVVSVRLYRPWRLSRFLEAIPSTCKRICVLERTKESGALGEPLFLDVAASLQTNSAYAHISVIGGRFGLGSKDFTPQMVMACITNMRAENPKHGFVVGIEDDLTKLSLDYKCHQISSVPKGTTECMFWGMGSDGTVGANKNVIKILGQNTPLQVQGYFAYTAHKAGGLTFSHLRFGPKKIRSQYLLQSSDYVAVHRAIYIQMYDCLDTLKEGGTFVLNTPWTVEELDLQLPARIRREIASKNATFYIIDANKVAAENGMGRRINNVLMTSFFKLSGVLPFEEAIALFKKAIQKTYGKKGMHVVEANWKCVDAAVDATRKVDYDREDWLQASDSPMANLGKAPATVNTSKALPRPPAFVESVMLALEKMGGDDLPTSAFQGFVGGVIPPGTAGFEKRGIAMNVPVVDMDKCTQCNHCSFVCPHAAIRPFLIDDDEAENAPEHFVMKKAKGLTNIAQFRYRIQVSPFDCTGCELCYIACPDDALKMIPLDEAKGEEVPNWAYAIGLTDRSEHVPADVRKTLKGSQFYTPMFEFSGACEGCGETPYIKLLTQLFGERAIIANATGCTTISSASYPANAYTVNQKGLGPAWGNSLFEDNAEYGFGMVMATAHRRQRFRTNVETLLNDEEACKLLSEQLRGHLSHWLLNWTEADACNSVYDAIKDMVVEEADKHPLIRAVAGERDMLPKLCQWIIGGDGWAYDIGFGGLDHVLCQGVDVNILVLDTEVYSNTGGQASKATTMGAVHKFCMDGRLRNKKDLGAICMEYGDVYVASVASSANMTQTVRAFVEAEAYPGVSIIMAYSPCIEHQYIKPFNLQIEHCKLAVESGYWPLYRYNPALQEEGQNPFQLDSRKIKADIIDLLKKENRFGTLRRSNPVMAAQFEVKLKEWAMKRFEKLQIRAAGFSMNAQAQQSSEDGWNVIYGTETGNCEEVAKRICELFKEREIPCSATQMDEIAMDDFSSMKRVIVVCSTHGQGALPGNAKEFFAELEKQNDSKLLENMSYAVMGLGDSSYVFFCQSAKNFDSHLERLGAKRICTTGLGDDQDPEGYDTVLSEWLPTFLKEAKVPEPKTVSEIPDEPTYSLTETSASDYKACQHHGSQMIKLVKNERMTPADYDVDVRHLEFDLSGTGMKYALGDSLAIFPQNDAQAVDDFCAYYGFNADQWVAIKASAGKKGSSKMDSLFKHPMTVRQLFTECLDVFGKPNRRFYETLWKYCTDPAEKEVAKGLLNKENREQLSEWTQKLTVTCFDVLKKFTSTKANITIPHLIDLIPLLKCRYYSIASSQRFVGQDKLQLCIGIVEWDANSQHRFGECTGYIARTSALPAQITTSTKVTAFNLPPTDMHPIIVAGMGTGLAPFRAFVQYRKWVKDQGKPIGPLMVYFGCRYRSKDYLYSEELEAWEKEGVISELKTAFSRDQKEKFYIQHAMLADPETLYKRLVLEDGYFYLCGSAKQVPIDIRNAIIRVLCSQGGMDEKTADDTITQWQVKGKYNVEAW